MNNMEYSEVLRPETVSGHVGIRAYREVTETYEAILLQQRITDQFQGYIEPLDLDRPMNVPILTADESAKGLYGIGVTTLAEADAAALELQALVPKKTLKPHTSTVTSLWVEQATDTRTKPRIFLDFSGDKNLLVDRVHIAKGYRRLTDQPCEWKRNKWQGLLLGRLLDARFATQVVETELHKPVVVTLGKLSIISDTC